MKTSSSTGGVRFIVFSITAGMALLGGIAPRTFAVDCSPAPAGLVSWWRAEGDASDAAGSSSGTVVGATFVAGQVGEAFNFNGTGQKITVPDSDALKLTNSMTIEAWIYARANGFILFRGDSRPGLDPYVLSIELTHELQFNMTSGSGAGLALRTPNPVPMNQWLHVAATLDGATGDIRLYVDGALASQTNTTLRPFRDLDPNYGAGIGVGGHSGGYNYFSFDGMIDELSVYDRALGSNEIAAIYAASSSGKCPAPSLVVLAGPVTNNANGHAYFLLSDSTWTEAEAKAVELGGHLVTVNDAAENNWVFDTFSFFGGSNRHLWIGLNDAAQEGTFVWSSGEPIGYTDWYPGEPNNYNNDDYAHIWAPNQPNADRRWNDASVISVDEIGRPFCGVVEVGSNAPPPEVQIVSGPVTNSANGHAYYLLSGSTWTEAEAKAVQLGGHLVTINDVAENNWVFDTFSFYGDINRHLWIGLNDAAQEGTFVWSSGEPVGYSNWYPGEPNNYNNDDYAHIWAPNQPNADRRWTDASVISVDEIGRPFCGVVEVVSNAPVEVQIVSGPVTNSANGHAYYLLSGSTWTEAEAKAVTLGGHLVTINDADENAWVQSTFSGGGTRGLWIGLNDAASEGNFTWVSGDPSLYRNWYPGEPNNYGDEDYAYIGYPTFADGTWNDQPDNAVNPASGADFRGFMYGVVEISPPTPPVQIIAGPTTNGANSHVYFLLGTSSWTEAEAKAIALGGHLATINDADENAWVHSTFSGDGTRGLWIGFNDAVSEGNFVWPSGEASAYSNWYLGEPNNYGDEDYAYIGFPTFADANWNDQPNNAVNPASGADYSAFMHGVVEIKPIFVPQIMSFTPMSGSSGTVVTLTGLNFSPVAASNTVYLGAVRAVVTAASATSLTITAPVGVTYAPPTVTVGGLTAQARASFTPTFSGGGSISDVSFAPRVNLMAGNGPIQTVIADLDGDGKPDLAVTDNYANTISLYRNISVAGTLDVGSFESRVVIPASGAGYSPYIMVAADVDGDGKLDLVTSDIEGNTVSVFRSQSVPGTLNVNSFAPFVSFAVGSGPRQLAVADLDGDGRPEIVVANYGSSTVSVLRNTGAAGQISANSFAPKFDLAAGEGTHGVAVADLDGDGKLDLVTADNVSATVSLFRNIGTGPLSASSFAPEVQIAAPYSAHFLRVADLDGDGKLDLVLTSYLSDPLTVYRNQSSVGVLDSASFAAGVAFGLSGRGHTVSAGDLNGDGKVDLAVDTEIGDSVALLQNLSTSGDFTSASLAAHVDLATGWNAWGSSVGDLDGDGRPDVVFANAYEATISICRNLLAGNHAPIADASAIATLVVSPNGSNAPVVLNGTKSSDPDGDALTYAWFHTGASNAFATGVVANVTLHVGSKPLTLVVSDGKATGSQNITVEVKTAGAAFNDLRALIRSGHLGRRAAPLLAALSTAEFAANHGHKNQAIARLRAFKFWVRALVQPTDPALAAQLIRLAQAVIVSLGPIHDPTPHVVQIESIRPGAGGKPHLRIRGRSGNVYIVEVSTNMANWVPLGEATESSTGLFEFDDASTQTGSRFYRVVAPE